jgi:branched-chain amino acid transport system permease protein/urea transport system permease protein
LAGALFALQFSFVSPAVIGLALSTEILIWAAVGGKAVLMAAFIGALGVKWVEGALSESIGAYWLLVIGLAFVAVIVIFPQGLLGRLLDPGLPRRLRRP